MSATYTSMKTRTENKNYLKTNIELNYNYFQNLNKIKLETIFS